MISWQTIGAILLMVMVGAGSSWKVQDWRYGEKISQIHADHESASKLEADSARAEELRRQSIADQEAKKSNDLLANLEIRASAAESKSVGLRGEIDRLRNGRSATCDTIATQQRKAGVSAVVVLGGLLEESDRMAGDLAKALERSRIAGLSCEAIMDGIRNLKTQ